MCLLWNHSKLCHLTSNVSTKTWEKFSTKNFPKPKTKHQQCNMSQKETSLKGSPLLVLTLSLLVVSSWMTKLLMNLMKLWFFAQIENFPKLLSKSPFIEDVLISKKHRYDKFQKIYYENFRKTLYISMFFPWRVKFSFLFVCMCEALKRNKGESRIFQGNTQ